MTSNKFDSDFSLIHTVSCDCLEESETTAARGSSPGIPSQ
jgi:hypothetical protein